MASNDCCNVCANAWGTHSILLCALKDNRAMYATDVCDDFSPLKEGQERHIHYPPQIVKVGGTVFEMDCSDRFLIGEAVKHVKAYTGPLDVVVDIGAHVGTFSVWCAKKGATVYAFEPSDMNVKFLNTNLELNGEDITGTVYVEQVAISDTTGDTVNLKYAGVGTGQRSIDFVGPYPVENTVQTLSLKDMLSSIFHAEGKIDYLKCDIEGAEWRFCDMDPETRELVGKVGYLDMSIHPLSNATYFRGEDIDYARKMIDWVESCGLTPERYVLA